MIFDPSSIKHSILNNSPESSKLDFKSNLYGLESQKTDEKELLKDIVAFANTNGGQIVCGVKDEATIEGQISRTIEGVSINNLDTLSQKISNMIHDGVEPRLLGVETNLIQIQGKDIVVFCIPKSNYGPHRVIRSGKFFGRSNTSNVELSYNQIRTQMISLTVREELMSERMASELRRFSNAAVYNSNFEVLVHAYPLNFTGLIIDITQLSSFLDYRGSTFNLATSRKPSYHGATYGSQADNCSVVAYRDGHWESRCRIDSRETGVGAISCSFIDLVSAILEQCHCLSTELSHFNSADISFQIGVSNTSNFTIVRGANCAEVSEEFLQFPPGYLKISSRDKKEIELSILDALNVLAQTAGLERYEPNLFNI